METEIGGKDVGRAAAAQVPWNVLARRYSNLRLAPDPVSLYNRDSPFPAARRGKSPAMTTRRLFLAAAALAVALVVGGTPAPLTAQGAAPTLVVVGDSISAGYGLPAGAGWVDLLAARLKERGYPQRIVNASITGDTTAGGRARLPALLKQHRPAIVVVELGGNDGLRGGDLKATRENLDAMVTTIQRAGAKVLIIGMRLPPNYGPAYTREFETLYMAVSNAHKAALLPYFFDGFGEHNEMFQPDRIHPTTAAQRRLLDNVWPTLLPLLGKPR
jgi:acyl-CoA thioesterase-1